MEIDETDGNDGHIYRLTKTDEIHEIVIAEREINARNLEHHITEELIILM